jgi:hypothetical protein
MTTFASILVENNRYATLKVTKEQVDENSFKAWKALVEKTHRAAYSVYAYCENNNLTAENASVDKTALFDALREILAVVGDVNGHRLYANEALALNIIGYAGRRGNNDSAALKDIIDEISIKSRRLKQEQAYPNGKEEYLASLEARIAELEEQRDALLAQPDQRIKQPTMTAKETFRGDLERRIARAIAEQQAKSLEELDAEEAARKEARKASAKARKAAKKAAANA